MNLELDTIAKALYLRLAHGRIADTVELTDAVVADVDEGEALLGIEFVHAEDFEGFLREHPEVPALPSRLRWVVIDRDLAWEIEAGTEGAEPAERARLNLALNAALVAELLANPSLVDRIPNGATVIPIRAGAAHLSTDEAMAIASRIAEQGGLPVLQPLGMPTPKRPEWSPAQMPNVTVRHLKPVWALGDPAPPPRLRYYPDSDTMAVNLIEGREIEEEVERDGIIPLVHPLYGVLVVDQDSQIIVGFFMPHFQGLFLRRSAVAVTWLARADLHQPTPGAVIELLADLGSRVDSDEVGEEQRPPKVVRAS